LLSLPPPPKSERLLNGQVVESNFLAQDHDSGGLAWQAGPENGMAACPTSTFGLLRENFAVIEGPGLSLSLQMGS
jgi:hypothetical protein